MAWAPVAEIMGPPGAAGDDGEDGLDGNSVLHGSGVPSDGGTGVDGDFYIRTGVWTIYGPKTAGAWGSPTNIVGPSGVTTIAGASDYAALSDPAVGTAGLRTLGTGAVQAAVGSHNHSGTYDASGAASTAVSAHAAAGDPHPGYLTPAEGAAAYSALAHTHDVIVNMTDGATITPDASSAKRSIQRVTLGGNRTMAKPTNLIDGATILMELKQDGTGTRVPTWNGAYVFGTDIPAVALTTTANRKDFLLWYYNLADDKLYLMGATRGFA